MAPDTALTQLERVLQILALAGGEDGIGYDELASRLGVDRRQLDRDLAVLTERDFYLPAGSVNDVQVAVEADRVRVWTTGPFRRPARLTAAEAAALDLGIRILAAEREDPGLTESMRALLERVARAVPDDVLDRFAADGDPGAPDRIRALIIDAARRRLRVRLQYLKPEADAPEDRSVEPYTVAYAEGRWYVIGFCPERDAIRSFRTDRILEADVGDEPFEPPADFDIGDYVADGRVYQSGPGAEELEVVVRYGGRVAPWLIERGEGAVQEDGGVIVRHRVSDPAWIVREVLKYGRDARVLEPGSVREMVRQAVMRLDPA